MFGDPYWPAGEGGRRSRSKGRDVFGVGLVEFNAKQDSRLDPSEKEQRGRGRFPEPFDDLHSDF
jgi:hypothetical protein